MKMRSVATVAVIAATIIAAPAVAAGSVRASDTNSVVKSVGGAGLGQRAGAQLESESHLVGGSWLLALLAAAAAIAGIAVAASGGDKSVSN
jgi:hypothetical protein